MFAYDCKRPLHFKGQAIYKARIKRSQMRHLVKLQAEDRSCLTERGFWACFWSANVCFCCLIPIWSKENFMTKTNLHIFFTLFYIFEGSLCMFSRCSDLVRSTARLITPTRLPMWHGVRCGHNHPAVCLLGFKLTFTGHLMEVCPPLEQPHDIL